MGTGILRDRFKTRQVFCKEEGAFVYPDFSSVTPLCKPAYFLRIRSCSHNFQADFQQGRPALPVCSEYFKANECQRLVTSEECTLGTRDMLVFGLQLQYQFAHNPFCEHVPVAEWWPEPSRSAPGAAAGSGK